MGWLATHHEFYGFIISIKTASRFNLRNASSKKFPGGHALKSPSKSMLSVVYRYARPTLLTLSPYTLKSAATYHNVYDMGMKDLT